MDTFHIVAKPQQQAEIVEKLGNHIDAVIYNVTSIAVIFAMLKGDSKVQPKHLIDVTKYISTTCPRNGQMGGMSMASNYFGYPHPSYAAGNSEGVVMSEVQFDNGIARAGIDTQVGMSGGAANNLRLVSVHDNNCKAFVRSIMALHNMPISKTGLGELLRIIDIHLNCLANDLAAYASSLTISRLDKVLGRKRHSVFH